MIVPNHPSKIGMLARCASSALSHMLYHSKPGYVQDSQPCAHLHLITECHSSVDPNDPAYAGYDMRFWSINGESVGNQHGLIAAYMQIVISHAVECTHQNDYTETEPDS